MVLRVIHGKVDICQADYSIHSKLRIQANERLTERLKKNDQLSNLMLLYFL